MGPFLAYSIVSGLLMLAMYLAYRVFLAGDNRHGYNRGVLLLIYAVSFAAVPVLTALRSLESHVSQGVAVIEGIETVDAVVVAASGPAWGSVLIWIFIAGMVVTAVSTVATWVRLIGVIRSGERVRQEGYSLVIIDNDRFAPFSWMKYVVISRSDYNDNYAVIAAHELKHVSCHHWVDLLAAQSVCIINWFNPVAWLMRDELMLVHEYQADMAVIESGADLRHYQMLLIRKAVGARFPSLANSLNHSKLKKRITMMYKEKSGAGSRFGALALVPMLALALAVVSMPPVRAAVSTIGNSKVYVRKDSENRKNGNASERTYTVKSLSNNDNRTVVVVKCEGNTDGLGLSSGTFTTCGKTYRATSMQVYKSDGVARIVVHFPFIDEFEDSSMTLTISGENVHFDLEDFFNRSAAPIMHAEVLPEYPGGESAMMRSVLSKATFPDPGRQWKVGAGGLSVVGFTVQPDGSMTDFELKLSCGYGDLDQIAIDAVKNGLDERWTPGTVGGKPVAVSYSIPIRFKPRGNGVK